MSSKFLLLTFLTFFAFKINAQTLRQYFDGADTSANNSFQIHLDTASSNIWQIGRPQKTIFDSANTRPNVLITDTINTYPDSNVSRFTIKFDRKSWNNNLLYAVAFRWTQKLDMDTNRDGGIVEYSIDTGATWRNIFNNPGVYNFYGFDTTNRDTLLTGEYAFSGIDSTWRDIWLCFKGDTLRKTDSFFVRFTFKSDTINNVREGWMIDNMMVQPTYFHTVNKVDPTRTFMVYPTITTDAVMVHADADDVQKIGYIHIIDAQGRVLKQLKDQPKKVKVDMTGYPSGNYYLQISTGNKMEVHQVVLL